MTPALRSEAMRAILIFHNCEGQSHKTVSTDHNFRSERRAEAVSNRGPSAYQPNALPLGQTGSQCATGANVFCLYTHSLLKINHGSRTVFGIPRKIVAYFGATWNKVGTPFFLSLFFFCFLNSALNNDRLLLFLLLLLFVCLFLSLFYHTYNTVQHQGHRVQELPSRISLWVLWT